MAIREHPEKGSILYCDFNQGFTEPEMVKRRPVIVVSPKIAARKGLCTVVGLSTTAPSPVMPYHAQLDVNPPLPPYFESKGIWIKGDMIYSVGFHRLDFISFGKDTTGKRIYYLSTISPEQLKVVQSCILRGMGMQTLTKHL